MERAGTHFHVVRLRDDAAALGPEGLQGEDQRLKGVWRVHCGTIGSRAASIDSNPESLNRVSMSRQASRPRAAKPTDVSRNRILMIDLHTEETLAWRALITRSEAEVALVLHQDVEAYLSRTLLRYLGRPARIIGTERTETLDALFAHPPDDPRVIGDRSLLLVGLFPEQVARYPVTLRQFIEHGRNAFRTCARRDNERVFADVDREYIRIIDVLRAMRLLTGGTSAFDLLHAYQLWYETGSLNAWRVLIGELDGLPASACSQRRH
jgi:hypothetical protein